MVQFSSRQSGFGFNNLKLHTRLFKAAWNVWAWLPNLIWQSIVKQREAKQFFKNKLYFLYVSYRFTLRFMAARPLTFFASPKKVSKERRPRLQVCCANFPLYTCFWRRSRVASLRIALVPAKTMFRSAAPRGRLHGLYASGSLNKIVCKWLCFIAHT